MPGQTDWRVQITHYLSHRDYTIVQRECYHRHAKRRLPCVTAACEQDPRKYLKNTVCSQGLSTSCPFRLKSKGDPVSLIYLDVTPVPVSCIWVCFPLLWPKIGTNHTRASCADYTETVKAIKCMQNIITMCDSLNKEPVWPGLDHHPAVLA